MGKKLQYKSIFIPLFYLIKCEEVQGVWILLQGTVYLVSPHPHRQTQQTWFLKWLPRLVHQLLLWSNWHTELWGAVVQTSGSLYGGATGFNSWTDSLLWIHQWGRSCCWWVSDPPLRRRHHSVYFRPFYGHCVNNPPGKLQCHTTLLPWPPIALKYK